MEAKLRSILEQTPWSSLLKAFLFGAAWLAAPFWIFVAFAIYLYFVPFFQPWRMFFPFVLTLFLGSFIAPSIWTAAFFGVLFLFIIGIKDLIFVDRLSSYSLLIFVLAFLSFLYIFSRFDSGLSLGSFFAMLASALGVFLLGRGLVAYGEVAVDNRYRLTSLALVSFLVFEFGLTLLILPINFFYQTAILFLFTVISLEALMDHLLGRLSSDRKLAYFSLFFAVFVLILASAEFTI